MRNKNASFCGNWTCTTSDRNNTPLHLKGGILSSPLERQATESGPETKKPGWQSSLHDEAACNMDPGAPHVPGVDLLKEKLVIVHTAAREKHATCNH
jgi:hypothetical protein